MTMKLDAILDKFTNLLAGKLTGQTSLSVASIPRPAEALLVRALAQSEGRPVVWIADGAQSLSAMHQDLRTLTKGMDLPIVYYPAWDGFPAHGFSRTKTDEETQRKAAADPEITGQRLAALINMTQGSACRQDYDNGSKAGPHVPTPQRNAASTKDEHTPPVIITCVQALMQKTCSPAFLAESTSTISVGNEISIEKVTEVLTKIGYRFEVEVMEKGMAAVRGGILDIWPSTETWPLRIEFMGDLVESIRAFNPADQKSQNKLPSAVIPPANEFVAGDATQNSFLAHLPDNAIFVWSQMESILDHVASYDESIAEAGAGGITIPFDTVRTEIEGSAAMQVFVGRLATPVEVDLGTDIKPIDGLFSIPREALQPDVLEQARHKLLADLERRAERGDTVAIFFDTPASIEHFRKQAAGKLSDLIQTEVGALSCGFISEAMGLTVVSESDLYGRKRQVNRRYDPESQRRRPARDTGSRISDLADIEPGDPVVHAEHGIGIYRGMFEIAFNGRMQEVLTIEYADKAKLHVPVSHAHLLSRYVGISRRAPQLHRLGGKRWNAEKSAAEHAIQDMSASLLEMQAQRSHLPGHSFPPDTPWQHEFEASFPYWETTDQHAAIIATKGDMESSKPMDRLVCGDAGYGKTEVAMRAAFKAVMGAKQVAVLVPTTVLAQQHFDTFRERMSSYPVRIEALSRFVSRGRHCEILKSLAEGTTDIVIGTHALLQDGVRFKDLGLVIVDEEQRFGVTHKEKLKHIRQLVDVLTLTATPIPRTLYMSMTGARDMSLIQTPPGERMAIETIVAPNTDKVIREAIVREIGREGQVFYLHNRIATIGHVEQRLAKLVPEARVAIAHGQMAPSELAAIMEAFVNGEFDILLSTTIIESGMDIPRANTILIDRADRFGIADLYQLRGRVGRSNRKAYAYLLLPEHGVVDSDARKRISALKQHSSLGAGFTLALRDLEIRGGGNLLGMEQSGHITAIGFGLYCQLLKRTIAQQKGEVVPTLVDVEVLLDFISLSHDSSSDSSAIIPFGYIEDERLRVSIYRRMAETTDADEVAAVRTELRDRFGSIPTPTARLLKIAELRVLAAGRGISRVETREGKVMLTRENDYLQDHGRFPRLTSATPDRQLDEVLKIVRSIPRQGAAAK
jgi:transcription-repair coupling factor (superfamily II helicase)